MNGLFLEFTTIALSIVVAFNLWLTFRLHQRLGQTNISSIQPDLLAAGTNLPYINGYFLADNRIYDSTQRDCSATVFVFLSTRCSDCRKKIPELIQILPAIKQSEIDLIIVGMESPHHMSRLLSNTPLYPHTVQLDHSAKKSLNPLNATPFYLFVDGNNFVQASHFIGDENWLAFLEQMHGILDNTSPTRAASDHC